MNKHWSKAFTLVELLVVVTIVAILAAIAIPSYNNQVRKTNRSAAEEFVQRVANRQNQYLLDYRTFAADLATLGMTTPDEVSRHYCINVAADNGPPPTFTVEAEPRNSSSIQAGSGSFSLNQAGTLTEATDTCA